MDFEVLPKPRVAAVQAAPAYLDLDKCIYSFKAI